MNKMRQKAMEMMMGDEKPMAMKKKPVAVEVEITEGEGEMESMLVTPEEKQMIMEARQAKQGEEEPSEEYAVKDSPMEA